MGSKIRQNGERILKSGDGVKMLRASKLSPISVTITGGAPVMQNRCDYRLPKRDLVSVMQMLL
jgi:hypothetical protein